MYQSTQYNQILAHLKQSKAITQAEAIQLFNCYCLSSVISRLRKAGHHIVTHYEPNLVNKGTHARYSLERNEQ